LVSDRATTTPGSPAVGEVEKRLVDDQDGVGGATLLGVGHEVGPRVAVAGRIVRVADGDDVVR
jgi:hypothetical protein